MESHFQATQQYLESLKSPHPSCYFCTDKHPMEVPLLSVDYKVRIRNNFVIININLVYANPLDRSLEIFFSLPTNSNLCFGKLEAAFNGYTVQAVVRERSIATREYKPEKKEGGIQGSNTVRQVEMGVVSFKLGKIAAGERVTIEYEASCQLEQNLASQWHLTIPSSIFPRYSKTPQTLQQFYGASFPQAQLRTELFTELQWTLSIDLQTTDQLLKYDILQHQCNISVLSSRHVTVALTQSECPDSDLEFKFSYRNINIPQVITTTNAAMVSFYPETDIVHRIAQSFESFQGEFIFLFDRSESMNGSKILQARNALILFLKSLPSKSMFNVISFGSRFESLFPQSVTYEDTHLEKAVSQISRMDANMGGTDVAAPLVHIKSLLKKSVFRSNIIVLTDGTIEDIDGVVKLIETINQENDTKTHTIGLGYGVSRDLIRRGALSGRGHHVFVTQGIQLQKQIIGLLSSIISPSLQNVQIICNDKVIDRTVSSFGTSIGRGSMAQVLVLYKDTISPPTMTNEVLTIKYLDTLFNEQKTYNLPLRGKSDQRDSNLAKYTVFKDNLKLREHVSKPNKVRIIRDSIKYQVPSPYTEFACHLKTIDQTKFTKSFLTELKTFFRDQSSLGSNRPMLIYVKTLTGRSVEVEIQADERVGNLKQSVQMLQGILFDQQKLVFEGKQLEDEHSLEYYHITPGATVHLVLKGAQYVTLRCYGLDIKMVPSRAMTVKQLKSKITQTFPEVNPAKIKLYVKEILLDDDSKACFRYGSGSKSFMIQLRAPKLFGSNQLVEMVSAKGSWKFDQEAIDHLKMSAEFNHWLEKTNDKDLAFTIVIYIYLKTQKMYKETELKLLYIKVERHLKTEMDKIKVDFNDVL